jgi:hypothetical protein
VSELRLEFRRQLETLGVGLLLLWGWLTFAGMAFMVTFYLFIPTSIGYAFLSRARSIRERRILALISISLAVFSAVVFADQLWVALNQQTEIIIEP